jgi:ArsR family transcriptional regulator, arsenate/arsenite/antimonite-responsive transcriptional repressor
MRQFIRVAKALSDPGRAKILKLLQHRSMCVCEIQAALELAQPTISKHLKILEEAGLETYRKSGLWVNYSLADGRSNPYAATLSGNLRHWLENDPEVLGMTKRLPEINREQNCKR